ncbi:MAG: DNA-directed RNA polymerase subunit L [Methanobacteriota archaeon]|nr:MAG: DNA-directed RNA polymerase subunit L [Euryarchaeota archaeon]RPJ54426.1 MAG: DNA-directed RNA polymerase subunit L [Euryarchaeota archaeon]
MQIKVLDVGKNRARIIFPGEGHTFMNLLTDEILKDPQVDVARYTMEFQFSDPELLVTTSGDRDPIAAIKDACTRIVSSCDQVLVNLK